MSIDVNNKENTNNEVKSDLVPAVVEVKSAKRPDDLTADQIKSLDNDANNSIVALVKAKGDVFSEETDNVINVGLKDQNIIATNIQLMQERMGNVFYNKEKTTVIDNMSKDISELQTALAKVSPKYIQREARYRIIKIIPFFGNYLVNVMKESSTKGMTLKSFVEDLSESIVKAEITMKQNNAQLKVINDSLKEKQLIVQANAYSAEKMLEILSEQIKTISDVTQNIRTTENIIQQFVAEIRLQKTNNDYLVENARETKTNGIMLVNISMAIHAAIVDAKNVKDLLVGTGEFEGKLLLSNATMLNTMVTEIGEIRKNPFVPMKYMEGSVAQVEEAIDKANKQNIEVIESSKANVIKIKVWTEDLKSKAGELPDMEVKSLEASKTLMLGSGK
jgi:hypothetical protein